MAVILHDIRSAHNVGSIFRTADGAGVAHVYLTGYTPRPVDAFKRPQKDIAKTALGAELSVPWTYRKQPEDLLNDLKRAGWRIVGVEQDARAIEYRTLESTQPVAFLLGNEVEGIPEALRAECDMIVEIPMHGAKESLNVSVAAGIILFAFARA